jgi:Spy/CpxP family protein refolding chaperone
MRGKWLALIAVASLALNVAVVGTYVYRTTRPHGKSARFRGVRRALRDSIGKAMREAAPDVERLSGERDRLHAAVMELVARPELDEQKLDSLCREQGRVTAELGTHIFRNMHRVVQMLPPEQRERFLRQPGPHLMRGPHLKGPGRFGPPRRVPESCCPPGGPEAPPGPDGD